MTLRTRPYRYQRKGVRIIHRKFKGRALLGDDPGLGKTLQALMYKVKHIKGGPTIIVCPAGLKWQWQDQCWEHCGIRAEVLETRTPPRYSPMSFRPKGTYIINYDILGDPKKEGTWLRFLRKLKPVFLIGDEIHLIQNRGTIRSRAFRKLSRKVKKIILMSGTPATSFPAQLWPALNILRPKEFNSFYSFAHRYCDPKRTPWGWTFTGATNKRELNEKLRSTCMVRRRKEDVLKDLPAKIRSVIPVDIKRRKDYSFAERDLIRWLLKKRMRRQAMRAVAAERLVRLGYLKRYAAELKMPAVIEWIKEFLATGKKLIVFGIHKKILKMIRDAFPGKAVLVTGEVTGHKRQQSVDAFNKDKRIRLFIGNVDAAGVGWNCKSASDVLFVEFPWVPGKVTQAEDRIHGIGRGVAGRRAFVHFIVAHGTIEEMLVKVLNKKQKNLADILDGRVRKDDLNVLDLMEQAYLKMGRKAA